MSSSNPYSVPPPSYAPGHGQGNKYGSTNHSGREGADEPLLAGSAPSSSSAAATRFAAGGGFYDQPEDGDLPDDFKYGVSVSEASREIQHAFVRKVYSILFCQILATCIVSAAMKHSAAVGWVQENSWAFFLAMFGTFINLGLLYWKRHNHPWNLVLLSTFTLLEAFTLGVVVAFYDQVVVLQALIITLGVFLGLTLFTLQSKYDFSGWGTYLFGGLLALLMAGLVQAFIGFGKTSDLIYAMLGTVLFSGYIIYDTFMITRRLSPDEYIMGAISLYLDFINLFLNILRVLNNVQSD